MEIQLSDSFVKSEDAFLVESISAWSRGFSSISETAFREAVLSSFGIPRDSARAVAHHQHSPSGEQPILSSVLVSAVSPSLRRVKFAPPDLPPAFAVKFLSPKSLSVSNRPRSVDHADLVQLQSQLRAAADAGAINTGGNGRIPEAIADSVFSDGSNLAWDFRILHRFKPSCAQQLRPVSCTLAMLLEPTRDSTETVNQVEAVAALHDHLQHVAASGSLTVGGGGRTCEPQGTLQKMAMMIL